jgi:hypothetical protein
MYLESTQAVTKSASAFCSARIKAQLELLNRITKSSPASTMPGLCDHRDILPKAYEILAMERRFEVSVAIPVHSVRLTTEGGFWGIPTVRHLT